MNNQEKGTKAMVRALVCTLALCFSGAARADLNLLPTEALCLELAPREEVWRVFPIPSDPTKIMAIIGDERSGLENIVRRYWLTGQRDESFAEYRTDVVRSLTELPDGGWLVLESGRPSLRKISATGVFDPSFGVQIPARSTIKVLADGSFYADEVGGTAAAHTVIRYRPTGAIDETFVSPVFDRTPAHMEVSSEGEVYVAGGTFGTFTRVNGVPRNGFAKLRFDGSLDPDFIPAAPPVWIWVSGNEIFAAHDPRRMSEEIFSRMLPNGAIDPTFLPFSAKEGSLFRDSLGRFYSPTPDQPSPLYRYISNGAPDPTYTPGYEDFGQFHLRSFLLNDNELIVQHAAPSANGVDIQCERSRIRSQHRFAKVWISGETKSRIVAGVLTGDGGVRPYLPGGVEEVAGEIPILVFRTGSSAGAATFNFKTRGGAATEGADYLPAEGSIQFAPGEISKTIRFVVRDDPHPELDELLYFDITDAAGAFVNSFQVRIVSRDEGFDIGRIEKLEDMKWRIPQTMTVSSWDFLATVDFSGWLPHPTVYPAARDGGVIYLLEFDAAAGPHQFFQARQRQ